jgi:hypothetical protein
VVTPAVDFLHLGVRVTEDVVETESFPESGCLYDLKVPCRRDVLEVMDRSQDLASVDALDVVMGRLPSWLDRSLLLLLLDKPSFSIFGEVGLESGELGRLLYELLDILSAWLDMHRCF